MVHPVYSDFSYGYWTILASFFKVEFQLFSGGIWKGWEKEVIQVMGFFWSNLGRFLIFL